MANSSRVSFPLNEETTNAGTSNPNLPGSSNRRPHKRARYSRGSKYRPKTRILQPFLGFENENLKTNVRGSLHLDERFFPLGISPGMILEIKGPEKSGKTFLLTYFIARTLVVYPEKKVVLIDTRHKFSVKSFVSIVCHFDKDICKMFGTTHDEREQILSQPLPDLIEKYPKLSTYLRRVEILQCHTPEDLLLNFGPPGESVVQKLLQQDQNVCLIAVDSIDNYSYSESMQLSPWANQWPNIMHILRSSVNSTRCPVMCTTLMAANKHAYHAKRTSVQSNTTSSGSNAPTSLSDPSNEPTNSSPASGDANLATSSKKHCQEKEAVHGKKVSNFSIDHTVFTNILELNSVPQSKKEKLVHTHLKKINHCVEAYLRSRHNANTAGSGGNHLVKFSIFSDMLWII